MSFQKAEFLKKHIPKFDYGRLKTKDIKDHVDDIKIPQKKQYNEEFDLAKEILKTDKIQDPYKELKKKTSFDKMNVPQARTIDLGLQTDTLKDGSKKFYPEHINDHIASFKVPKTLSKFNIKHDAVDSLLRFYDNYLPQKYFDAIESKEDDSSYNKFDLLELMPSIERLDDNNYKTYVIMVLNNQHQQ